MEEEKQQQWGNCRWSGSGTGCARRSRERRSRNDAVERRSAAALDRAGHSKEVERVAAAAQMYV